MFVSGRGHVLKESILMKLTHLTDYPQNVVILSDVCPFRMSVGCPKPLCRVDKNLKKDIHRISVSAVRMFLGCPTDIQRIGPNSGLYSFRW